MASGKSSCFPLNRNNILFIILLCVSIGLVCSTFDFQNSKLDKEVKIIEKDVDKGSDLWKEPDNFRYTLLQDEPKENIMKNFRIDKKYIEQIKIEKFKENEIATIPLTILNTSKKHDILDTKQ